MTNYYFITSNQNKVQEVCAILGMEIKNVSLDIKEIQSLLVEEVVREKAFQAYKQIKKPVIIEDTGLYIESLNGFPGALAKWILKTIGQQVICDLVKDEERKAYARTCVGLYDGSQLHFFIGRIDGAIAKSPRGQSGFGWDPIFIPAGFDKTFAEMGTEEKNKISMRRQAFLKMKEFLEKSINY